MVCLKFVLETSFTSNITKNYGEIIFLMTKLDDFANGFPL